MKLESLLNDILEGDRTNKSSSYKKKGDELIRIIDYLLNKLNEDAEFSLRQFKPVKNKWKKMSEESPRSLGTGLDYLKELEKTVVKSRRALSVFYSVANELRRLE